MENEAIKLSEDELSKVRGVASALTEQIEMVIIGKHNEVVLLVTAMLSGGHVLIEDVPGVGKTTLAAAFAKAAGLSFRRAQFTPDVTASDITGFNIYNRSKEEFELREGLVMCNILLADEINRASARTQSALLEAMEEKRVTVDGRTYDIPDPFMVVATQNPSEFVGTNPLPEAQLDRFAMRLSLGYPSFDEEMELIRARRESNPLDAVEKVTSVKAITALRAVVSMITVDDEIYRYIVKLVTATRSSDALALGASPRASLTLMRTAQAYAFMHNRSYVLPEDVAALINPVLSHRLVLKPEAKLSHITVESVLKDILRRTDAPFRGGRG